MEGTRKEGNEMEPVEQITISVNMDVVNRALEAAKRFREAEAEKQAESDES